MASATRLITACCLAVASFSSATSVPTTDDRPFGPSEAAARRNAYAIFNAVHSALRQWGSSLNHNGLSVFLATIPEGVILHHGTNTALPPPGPEWLAFEIEHAELFARGQMNMTCGKPQACQSRIDQQQQPVVSDLHRSHHPAISPAANVTATPPHGYLHLYRTTAPLRLLYLDGMSAADTTMGTLDLQDFVLRGDRAADPPADERARAAELCGLARAWGLHGLVRAECGFEVIKCAPFLERMELLAANRRPDDDGGGDGSGSDSGTEGRDQVYFLEFVRALAQRYHGIGGGRARVDYSSMVSAFFYEVNLTNPDPQRAALPRLVGLSDGELRGIRRRVEEVVRNRRGGDKEIVDWQGVTDMVVARYADRLKYMAWQVESLQYMQGEVNALLNTHIDYGAHDEGFDGAIGRCTRYYTASVVPRTQEDGLVLVAIETVMLGICSALFRVRELVVEDGSANDESLVHAKSILRELMEQLKWTRWKECSGCGYDEVCFLPMAPFGDKDSYERPNCRNATTITKGWWDNGYWEWPRTPRPTSDRPGEAVEKGLRDL